MNNKKLGTALENKIVKILTEYGFWCRLQYPAPNGSQPFDIMAMKSKYDKRIATFKNFIYCIDAKTLSTKYFSFNRLEENQRLGFESIRNKVECAECFLLIEFEDRLYRINYDLILGLESKGKKGVTLDESYLWG